MTKIKTKDFVEIDYTGMITESNAVFDTTLEKVAKENHIHNTGMTYQAIIICVGEHQVPIGLDHAIEGKEPGEYEIKLAPEDAFGKKSAKMLKMVPQSVFKKQNINPQPGLQVEVDGHMGVIKNNSGGRIIVDFNHPLSSKEVTYKINIKRILTDDAEKIRGYLSLQFNLKPDTFKIEVKEGHASIGFVQGEFPEELKEPLKEKLINLIDSVKDVSYPQKQSEKEDTASSPKKEV